MTARLAHEGPDTFVRCVPCDMDRYEPNRATAQRLVADHNHKHHKES